MGRRMTVRIVAWVMSDRRVHRLSEDDVRGALIKAFPHRDVMWRTGVIRDALARNERKAAVR